MWWIQLTTKINLKEEKKWTKENNIWSKKIRRKKRNVHNQTMEWWSSDDMFKDTMSCGGTKNVNDMWNISTAL